MIGSYKIGIMQGRLSRKVGNKIQCFPKKNWKKEFYQAKKLKLNFIEWTLDYSYFAKNPIFTKEGVSKIKELSKKYKIKIKSLTGDCFMERPFWKNNNRKLILDFKKILLACNKLKIKYLVIPLVDNGSLKKKSQEIRLIKILNSYKNFLKSKKIQILFESDYPPKKLKDFINNFDVKTFGINYDLGNSASLGYDLDEEFKLTGKYIKNIHIKDRKFNGETVRLGRGNVDFSSFFKNIKKINFKKTLILQTARSNNNKDIKEVEINLKYLKSIFMKFNYGKI